MEGKWVVAGVTSTRNGCIMRPSTMRPIIVSRRSNDEQSSPRHTPFPCAWGRAIALKVVQEKIAGRGGDAAPLHSRHGEKKSRHADSKRRHHHHHYPGNDQQRAGILIAGSSVRSQGRPNIAFLTVDKANGTASVGAKTIHKAGNRWGHSLIPLPARGKQRARALMFGGWDSRSQFNELLEISLLNAAGKPQQKQAGEEARPKLRIDVEKVNTSGKTPSHRSCHSMTRVAKGKFLVFGGSACGGGPYRFFNDVHLLEEEGGDVFSSSSSSSSSYRWGEIKCKGSLPSPRSQHSAVLCRSDDDSDEASMLLVIGGHDGSRLLNDVYSLDLRTYVWTKRRCTPASGLLPEVADIPEDAIKDFRVLPVQTGAAVRMNPLNRCIADMNRD